MLTCKETSQVLSEARDQTLPRKKRFMLKMHLMMCDRCHAYKNQLATLYQTYQKHRTNLEFDSEVRLPGNIKEEIKNELNDQSSQ